MSRRKAKGGISAAAWFYGSSFHSSAGIPAPSVVIARRNDARPALRAQSTGSSSARFGLCEVCGTHVSDVWSGTADAGFTSVFGHRKCVESKIGMPTRTALRAQLHLASYLAANRGDMDRASTYGQMAREVTP